MTFPNFPGASRLVDWESDNLDDCVKVIIDVEI